MAARQTHWGAVGIALAMSHVVLSLGPQHVLTPPAYALGLAASAALFLPLVLHGLRTLPHTVFGTLAPASQTAFVTASAALAILTWGRLPLDLADHALLGRGLTANFVNIAAMAVGGGFVATRLAAAAFDTGNRTTWSVTVPALLFGGLYLTGLAIYDDFGLSTDEPMQRRHGLVAMYHLLDLLGVLPAADAQTVPPLSEYEYRFYGTAQHLPFAFLELVNGLTDTRTIYLLRHFGLFFIFFLSVLAMYRMASAASGSWVVGMAGALLYVTFPRITAEAFYNIKDVLVVSLFTLALWFGVRLLRDRRPFDSVSFAVLIALATSIRAFVAGLFVLTLALMIYDCWLRRENRNPVPPLLMVGVFCATLLFATPGSWTDPLDYLVDLVAFTRTGTDWNAEILYLGRSLPGTDVPWHYIPVWIAITVPLPTLALAAIGGGAILLRALRHGDVARPGRTREGLFFLVLFVVPVAAAMLLRPTFHSGWRHLFFCYPALVMLAVYGLASLMGVVRNGRGATRLAAGGGLALLMALQIAVIGWMVRWHPFHQTYYNPLVTVAGGKTAFDRDYWRMSVRPLLDVVLRDPRPALGVAATYDGLAVRIHRDLMPAAQRQRLKPVADDARGTADYYVEDFRFADNAPPDGFAFVSEVVVDGLPVARLYRRTVSP